MDPRKILKIAKSKGFDSIAITDHNTIKGAIEAKKMETEFGVQVIIGSEIRTDIGDIIGLNIEKEILNRSWEKTIFEIKKQGGSVVFPHPFRDHTLIADVAKKVDLIEVWNARCYPEQNFQAMELAKSVNRNFILGSDAHLYSEIGNVCIKYNPHDLLTEEVFFKRYANESQIRYSQIIKIFKKNGLFPSLIKGGNYILNKILH